MSEQSQNNASPESVGGESSKDTIALDMFLKLANVAASGGAAKHLIQSGAVLVNNVVEKRRGKKLHPGDVVEVHGEQFVIESDGL
ncbi:MAG TPA: RNA-binding S4 domain-containing protein [Planctomycetaceae bacterium]|nr:RNA-binding S4 domain-containing protein [Planctomycetaceae bacterium]HQZ64750.1 RNA-binding S4 domain-containing protein [Planctomycetaceae bacterium]HRA87907.1 RNA-binding S4 domain-containing protein [Planctomycetaceae bacterium]